MQERLHCGAVHFEKTKHFELLFNISGTLLSGNAIRVA